MVLALSREYPCKLGAPVLDRVDPRIFRLTYFAQCMDCTFCNDACCRYGADIEMPRVEALDRHREELEAYLGVPRAEWFRENPDDFGVFDAHEYPGGRYTRTQVTALPANRSQHNSAACVFLDPVGRGCRIHRFAMERKIDVHEIKPMVCLLFPVSFDDGVLEPAYEFEFDDELVCQGPGASLYRSARSDIAYYFGDELVEELDRLEREAPASNSSVGAAISLPLCTV